MELLSDTTMDLRFSCLERDIEYEKARSKASRAMLASVNLLSRGLSGSAASFCPRARPTRQATSMRAARQKVGTQASSHSKIPPMGTPFHSGIAGRHFACGQAQHHQREAIEDKVDGHEQADDKKGIQGPGAPDPDAQDQVDDAVA